MNTCTLIIHGAFAAQKAWWRLGGKRSFAGRLEKQLAKRGIKGTVWKPALEHGLKYDDFSWSGANTDRARRQGARKLARSLEKLAGKSGATLAKPLRVNIIAHSHGGNVALECLRHLSPLVSFRRLILLGTPLVSYRPAFRPVRFLLGLLFFGLLITCMALLPLAALLALAEALLPSSAIGGFSSSVLGIPAILFLMTLVVVTPLLGWLFSLVSSICDILWYPPARLYMGIKRRWHGQAYGVSASRLRSLVENEKVTLLLSDDDEADLLLQLGAAPGMLYREIIEGRKLGPMMRSAERYLIRPGIERLFLRVIKMVLEMLVFGFSLRRVLFSDFKMADIKKGAAYPKEVLKKIDVTEILGKPSQKKLKAKQVGFSLATGAEKISGGTRRARSLRHSIQNVARDLTRQITLRHSLYYNTPSVIRKIADIVKK